MYGNIGTDVTHGAVNPWVGHECGGKACTPLRFFNALPRDVSLSADGTVVHVRAPPELKALRATDGPTATVAEKALQCGDRTIVSKDLRAAEFVVTLNVSELARGATIGIFLLASPGMEEVVFVGVNASDVFVDTTRSSQNRSLFNESFRQVLTAPLGNPKSGVLQLQVFLDETVIEVFASDCVCSSSDATRSERARPSRDKCDCVSSQSEVALAVTALAFPGGSLAPSGSATSSGLFATCGGGGGGGSASATASASVWALDGAPVVDATRRG
jgi:hypothetical protein